MGENYIPVRKPVDQYASKELTEFQVEKNIRAQPRITAELVLPAVEVATSIRDQLHSGKWKRLVLIGLGSSHHVAEIAGSFLRSHYGTYKQAENSSLQIISHHSLFLDACSNTDLVIAVTHRGGSAPTRVALEKAKAAGAETIVVCAKGAPAYACANHIWRTCDGEIIEPHTLALSSAIAVILASILGTDFARRWAEETHYLEKLIAILFSELPSQNLKSPRWILGEGINEPLAKEWALKIMEMTGEVPLAMSTEAFFHGPQFALKKTDVVGYLYSEEDARANSVQNLPQEKVILQNTGKDSHLDLGFLETLIRIQHAAFALAVSNKINPDFPHLHAKRQA